MGPRFHCKIAAQRVSVQLWFSDFFGFIKLINYVNLPDVQARDSREGGWSWWSSTCAVSVAMPHS